MHCNNAIDLPHSHTMFFQIWFWWIGARCTQVSCRTRISVRAVRVLYTSTKYQSLKMNKYPKLFWVSYPLKTKPKFLPAFGCFWKQIPSPICKRLGHLSVTLVMC